MSDANQIRINELARELEIKAKVLIEYLPEIGVTEKKTHSSSLDLDHAELVRKHFLGLANAEAVAEAEKKAKEAAAKSRPSAARPAAAAPVAAAPAAVATAPPAVAKPVAHPSVAPPAAVRPAAPAPRPSAAPSLPTAAPAATGCTDTPGCSASRATKRYPGHRCSLRSGFPGSGSPGPGETCSRATSAEASRSHTDPTHTSGKACGASPDYLAAAGAGSAALYPISFAASEICSTECFGTSGPIRATSTASGWRTAQRRASFAFPAAPRSWSAGRTSRWSSASRTTHDGRQARSARSRRSQGGAR